MSFAMRATGRMEQVVAKASTIPANIYLQPIDDDARDGRFQLVFQGGVFALVRWADGHWWWSSGLRSVLEPTHYHAARGNG